MKDKFWFVFALLFNTVSCFFWVMGFLVYMMIKYP